MKIPFWKVQAVGNDFVLVHLDDFTDADRQLPDLARDVSRRRFGVGSDGLLALGQESDRLRMRMFNPDGSEDFCGNGLRSAAAHAVIHGLVSGRAFDIAHLGHVVPAEVDDIEGHPSAKQVRTIIGTASFDPRSVPLTEGSQEKFETPLSVGDEVLEISSLTTGSTHTVIFVPELPADGRFEHLSQLLEHHPLFPERTSVIWVREPGSLEAERLVIRIWERGAGETLGCGTGSSAAAAAWFRRTGRGGEIVVQNPGGDVRVEMARWDAPIAAASRAEEVFAGNLLG
ncbi:MAG: diaminopimelate epimerase [Fimbriimonadaceae bacterium]|nr:diaminopimelate epimerase [Fimbriimonadaceae bacterium]